MSANISQRLGALFNVRPGEGRTVLLMMTFSGFMGVSLSYFFVAANALFLAEFDIAMMPYVFVASGVVMLLTQFVRSRIARVVSGPRLLVITLVFLILLVISLRLGLELTHARWLIFSLLIWFRVLLNLLLVGFWGLASVLFDLGQSKRLFSLISSGDVLIGTFGSFAIPIVIRVIGLENLLLAVAINLVFCLMVVLIILRRSRDRLSRMEPPAEAASSGSEPSQGRIAALLRNPYIRLIFALYLLSQLLNFFINFAFFDQLQTRYLSDPTAIASFMGILFGFTDATTLILKLFISGRLLIQYGVRFGLLSLPLVFTLAVAGASGVGLLLGVVGVFFWWIIAAKFASQVLRPSMEEPTSRVLYQPLPAHQRLSIVTFIEGNGFPLTAIIAGGLLLALTLTHTFSSLVIAVVMLVLGIAWILTAILVNRGYSRALQEALTRRSLTGEAILVGDAATRSLLHSKLRSPQYGEVIYALDFLEQLEGDIPLDDLLMLLRHPSPEVRSDVLCRIERLRPDIYIGVIFDIVETDDSPLVRAAALRAFCAFQTTNVIGEVRPYLTDADLQVRRGALVGLLRYGNAEAVHLAGDQLGKLAVSPQTADRILAADVLGELRSGDFRQAFVKLLNDKDRGVRRATLLAASQINDASLWPLVVASLAASDVTTAAASALVAADESVYPALEIAFNQPQASRTLLIRLARVYGRRRDPCAIEALKSRLNHPDKVIQNQVLNALNQCGYQAAGDDVTATHIAIEREVATAAEILATQLDLGDDSTYTVLQAALRHEYTQIIRRVLLYLAFIYEAEPINDIRYTLFRASGDQRAYALETLTIMLPLNLRNLCLPLIEDLSPAQRLDRLSQVAPQQSRTPQSRLLAIIDGHTRLNHWIKLCALYVAAHTPNMTLGEAVHTLVASPDALVRETTAYLLYKLDNERNLRHLVALSADKNAQVARIARQLVGQNGKKTMLLTIEKVFILKKISLFRETPDHILVEVASLVNEIELAPGTVLFEAGDSGNALYIIVDGLIQIYSGEQIIANLGEHEVIGEMSLLRHQPRSASARAISPVHLLRLDRNTFDELMMNQPEMARGIISILVDRLYNSTQQSLL